MENGVTVEQASKVLGISVTAVYQNVYRGKIRKIRDEPKKTLLDVTDVYNLLHERNRRK